MMLSTMLCLATSMFLTLPKINNPMMMTLMIIFIALMTASMFCMTLSSWYAFLIFLIYVGGMLVMFAYFTATSPNQQMSNKSVTKTLMLMLPITACIMFMNNQTLMTPTKSHQLMSMFTEHNMYTLIMITLILLITMVIVVKLSSRSKGPLRTFMT